MLDSSLLCIVNDFLVHTMIAIFQIFIMINDPSNQHISDFTEAILINFALEIRNMISCCKIA